MIIFFFALKISPLLLELESVFVFVKKKKVMEKHTTDNLKKGSLSNFFYYWFNVREKNYFELSQSEKNATFHRVHLCSQQGRDLQMRREIVIFFDKEQGTYGPMDTKIIQDHALHFQRWLTARLAARHVKGVTVYLDKRKRLTTLGCAESVNVVLKTVQNVTGSSGNSLHYRMETELIEFIKRFEKEELQYKVHFYETVNYIYDMIVAEDNSEILGMLPDSRVFTVELPVDIITPRTAEKHISLLHLYQICSEVHRKRPDFKSTSTCLTSFPVLDIVTIKRFDDDLYESHDQRSEMDILNYITILRPNFKEFDHVSLKLRTREWEECLKIARCGFAHQQYDERMFHVLHRCRKPTTNVPILCEDLRMSSIECTDSLPSTCLLEVDDTIEKSTWDVSFVDWTDIRSVRGKTDFPIIICQTWQSSGQMKCPFFARVK